MTWTVPEIVAYLDEHAITLRVHQGTPYLDPRADTPRRVLDRLVPHVKARRAELLAYFEGMWDVEPEKTREDVITDAVKRAVSTGKVCYLLLSSGLALDIAEGVPPSVREEAGKARYVCVGGDEQWTKLPESRA